MLKNKWYEIKRFFCFFNNIVSIIDSCSVLGVMKLVLVNYNMFFCNVMVIHVNSLPRIDLVFLKFKNWYYKFHLLLKLVKIWVIHGRNQSWKIEIDTIKKLIFSLICIWFFHKFRSICKETKNCKFSIKKHYTLGYYMVDVYLMYMILNNL